MGLNPDYLLKYFLLYILLFVFLINHDSLENSFVAFEFSGSSYGYENKKIDSFKCPHEWDKIIWIHFQEWLLIRKCEKEAVMQGMKNVTVNSNTLLIIGSQDQLF